MKHIAYLPVFMWGKNPDDESGFTYGLKLYHSLEDLYSCEDEVVGHIEVEIKALTENEFRVTNGLKSGAI